MVMVTASVTVVLTLLQLSTNAFATRAFNCKNTLITDEWREAILVLHNKNRRTLANGEQRGKTGTLPKAAKMNQLQWDCATEEVAQTQAANCGSSAPVPPTNYGTVVIKAKISGDCDPTTLAKTAIRNVWKEGAKKQTGATGNAYVAGNSKFNMMAYEDTDGMGCSYQRCSGELYIVCFYNKNPAKVKPLPTNLYEAAAATTCDGCPQVNGVSTCVDALCQKELTPLVISAQCNLANSKLMTDELRNTALYMHNYYRGLLASGWAKDGKIGYAKPAAAMIQLKYDCDVENKIMEKFKDCQTPTLTQPFNFKQYSKFEESRESALKAVIDEWWSALAKTGVTDNKYVEADMKDKPLGDYVNMAYDKTTKVGCGVQTCKAIGRTFVQCAYTANPLIDDGDPIYEVAKKRACSGCGKAGMTCSPLGALCVQK
ncbi:hypothetical protein Aduo_000338 [Ancylostoma duodenale]